MKKSNCISLSKILLFTANSILSTFSFSQAGSLDFSFGTGGIATTDFGFTSDVAKSVAIQPDGKLVVAGWLYNDANYEFALTRFNSDGSLDSTFGTDGKVITDFGVFFAFGNSVSVQIDGKIVLAGYSGAGYTDFTLVRYNSDGSLDGSFGTGGIIISDLSGDMDEAYSVVVQSDGKILVTGFSGPYPVSDFALIRYNTDGTLDNSFDSDGIVSTDYESTDNVGLAVALQSDSKILVAGTNGNSPNVDFALLRYNNDGSLDSSFGTDGLVTTDFGGSDDLAVSVAVQTDGKILIAGYSGIWPHNDFAIVRYNNDGSLDESFGTSGKVITDFGSGDDYGRGVTLELDGKILVTGSSRYGTYADIALVRYDVNGSVDTTFGSEGKITTAIGYTDDVGYSLLMQPDGKIVVTGYTSNLGNEDFAIVRYNNLVCDFSIDTSVVQNGNLLTANATGDSYLWIDCDHGNTYIPGETNQSYAPTTSGNYAVIIIIDGCWDTSSCYAVNIVGIQGNTDEEALISISPNPFGDELIARVNYNAASISTAEIILFDITGKETLCQKISSSETKINTVNIPPGFYLLQYSDGINSENFKLIKF